MTNTHGAYIVSWDFSEGNDSGVLIVGRQYEGALTIVNAFQGQDAYEIYEKLSTVKNVEEKV